MAGRRQFDVHEALDRAVAVFWQYGYAEASLEMLTGATGLGRGSLYGTFGDKDRLFRMALDRYTATYAPRFEAALAGPPQQAVEAFLGVTLARIADPAVPGGCLVVQSAAQIPTLSDESAAHVRGLLDAQRARIRRGLDVPGADPSQLDDLALFVVAANQSLAVLSRAGVPLAELRTVARLAAETVGQRSVGLAP